MAAEFKFRRGGKGGGRLHVGYRGRDWTMVWYEPIGVPADADGGSEKGLFAYAKGEEVYRAPMDGEVKWYPPFDPDNHESKTKGERERLQKQTLKDAYDYAIETNEERLQAMEAKFDNPQFARQYAWFCSISKWKKREKKRRVNARREREELARAAGENPDTCDINSDDSDSGYEDAFNATGITVESQPQPKRKRAKNNRYKGPQDSASSYGPKSKDGTPGESSSAGRSSLGPGSRFHNHLDGAEEPSDDVGIGSSRYGSVIVDDFDDRAPEEHGGVQIASNVPANTNGQPVNVGGSGGIVFPIAPTSHQATVESGEESEQYWDK